MVGSRARKRKRCMRVGVAAHAGRGAVEECAAAPAFKRARGERRGASAGGATRWLVWHRSHTGSPSGGDPRTVISKLGALSWHASAPHPPSNQGCAQAST